MKLAVIRDSLRATPRPWAVWLLEFLVNPALALLAIVWLQMPESGAGQLILSSLLALVLGVVFFTVAGTTLSWYGDHHAGNAPGFKSALGKGARHFLWIAIWALAALAVLRFVDWAEGYQYQVPNYLRSMMPAGLRAHTTEEGVLLAFNFVLGAISWWLLPVFWLPPAAQLAARGFKGFGREGFRAWWRSLKSWQYWVMVGVGAFLGVWLTSWLLNRPPNDKADLTAQLLSLVFRMILAYLLALWAWMMTASATGRAAVGAKQEAAAK
jgi:hypothetical protein